MKNWYLIHTKPQQEQLAKENLERQGYPVYLPLTEVRRKRRGRSVRIVDAMFPRYLFVHLSDESDDWSPIRSTIGVATLVRFGQTPAQIQDDLIDILRERENEAGIHILEPKEFEQGTRVRISEGPLEGYEGLFHELTGTRRVILLLQITENMARIQVDIDKIEPVS